MENSMMFEIRSPYLNSEGAPCIPMTLAVIFSRFPGKNRPIVGSTTSLTNAVTNLFTA